MSDGQKQWFRNGLNNQDSAERRADPSESKIWDRDDRTFRKKHKVRKEKKPVRKVPVLKSPEVSGEKEPDERAENKKQGANQAPVEVTKEWENTSARTSDKVRKKEKKEEKREEPGAWKVRMLYLVLSFAIPLLVMLICMIAYGVEPFGGKSLMIIDALHQYMPFFSVLYDKLKEGGSLFFSWRAGLGINFLSLMSYYLMSPLNLLIVFFSRAQLNMALSMILALKIALSGLSMGIWCNAKSSKPNPFTVAAACAYALNSYMVGYSWNVMWLDAIMVLPLILLGIDRLVEKNDGKLYGIALFYALFCNYYIGYMICIFCVLWFFMEHFEGVMHFLKRGISFSVYSLLSGGMAAVILIPAFLGIRQTAAGASVEFPDHQMLTTFPDLLNRQFNMAAPISHDNEFDGNANLYVGIFAVLLMVMYLLNHNIKLGAKIRRILVIGLLYVSFSDIFLNFIWHGFHDQYGIPNRFSFLLGFLLISMAFEAFENADGMRIWHVPIALLCSGGLLLCGHMLGKDVPEKDVFIAAILIMVIEALILLIFTFFNGREQKAVSSGKWTGAKFFRLAFTLLVVVEMSTTAILGFSVNGQINVPKFFRYTQDMEEAIEQVDDGTFYRSEVVKALMLDEAIYYPMNTVGLFGSTASDRMVTVMDQLGFATGANEYKYEGENPLTDYLLNVRYHYHKDTDNFTDGFQYKASVGQINVYENPINTSLGYMVRPAIEQYFENASVYPFTAMNDLAEKAFAETDIFKDIPISQPMVTECSAEPTGSPGEYRFNYENSADEHLSFAIPVKEGADNLCFYYDGTQVEKAVVSLNGKELVSGNLDGRVIECGPADEDSWLTVSMQLKGEDDTGIVRLSAADFDSEIMDRIASVQYHSGFMVDKVTDRTVRGTVRCEGSMTGRDLLFLSIPYDEGWTMKVDGKVVEPEIIGNAFLGVELNDGEHDLSLSYVSPGYELGKKISIISFIIFLALILIKTIWMKFFSGKEKENLKINE